MNKAILIGNVGSDPEVKTLNNGTKLATFSLATSRRYKTKDGEQKTDTQWHNIDVFGPRADVIEKYVTKGTKLAVEGEIRTNSWEDEQGNKKYRTSIVLVDFTFLGSNSQKTEANHAQQPVTDDVPF